MRLKKGLRLIVVGVVLLGLLGSAGACRQSEPQAQKTGKEGGTLIVGNPYGPTTFDPAYCTEQGGIDVIMLVFDSLIAHDDKYQIMPQLAESWESPDPVTWVFHLRKGVKWQDDNEVFPKGKAPEVTADDVKYTIERLLNPETKSTRASLVKQVDKVEAVDKYTVKITTKQPDAFFLDNLASVFIVNQQVIEKLGKDRFAKNPIGSGPFKFVEFVPDSHVKLRRNEAYFVKPYLDELTVKIIPDQNVLLVSLESGDVGLDRLLPSPEIPRIKSDSRYVTYPGPLRAYRYAAFNCKNPLFTDVRVRKAIAMALDLDSAIKAIFPEGVAERAYGPVPPNIVGHDPSLKDLWKYDPEGAKALLKEAGWKQGSDGLWVKDGKKLTFTIKAPSQDPNRSKFAVIMSEQLKAIGVKAEVQLLEWGTLISDMDSGNTDMYIVGGFSGPSGMIFLFHSRNQGSAGNASFYSNPQVDELLDRGAVTVDRAEREAIWKQAQRIVVQDFVHIPLYHEAWFGAHSTKVQDFMPDWGFVTVKNNTWLQKD
ncbi:MAG: ABC transporter substrate-binding protein [Bacillota bacterium]|nr:ABC transporter substrate-binding protein [Bacillota bacterium]